LPPRPREALQTGHDPLPLRIRVPERSAEERREPEAEHRAEVAFARRSQHPFVETADGLVHERESEPLRDVAGTRVGRRAEELSHARIWRASAAVVAVEAAALVLVLVDLGLLRHGGNRSSALTCPSSDTARQTLSHVLL